MSFFQYLDNLFNGKDLVDRFGIGFCSNDKDIFSLVNVRNCLEQDFLVHRCGMAIRSSPMPSLTTTHWLLCSTFAGYFLHEASHGISILMQTDLFLIVLVIRGLFYLLVGGVVFSLGSSAFSFAYMCLSSLSISLAGALKSLSSRKRLKSFFFATCFTSDEMEMSRSSSVPVAPPANEAMSDWVEIWSCEKLASFGASEGIHAVFTAVDPVTHRLCVHVDLSSFPGIRGCEHYDGSGHARLDIRLHIVETQVVEIPEVRIE